MKQYAIMWIIGSIALAILIVAAAIFYVAVGIAIESYFIS